MKKYIIPIFIPHRGCPHDCSFCNQRRIAGKVVDSTQEDVYRIIDTYRNLFPKTARFIEIAYYGGSFTGLPKNVQADLLKPASEYKIKGLLKDIRISTRPDYINSDILDLLHEYDVSIIELGVQSTDNEVLSLNRRGHSRKEVLEAVELIKQHNFKLGLQMMVGLLGDNEASIMKTAEDFLQLKPDFIRIYPTVVIKDTYLETLYDKGEYIPFTLQRSVDICKKLLLLFKKNNIPVIRLGLQTTEEITYGKAVIAGPYHPAFREIVESEIYKDIIEEKIKEKSINDTDALIIFCHPSAVSKVSGFKQSNKIYILDKYNFSKVSIKKSIDLRIDEIEIKIDT